MKNDTVLRAIGDIDDKFIERAAPKNKTAGRKTAQWLKWALPVAACFVIAVMIIIPLFNNSSDFNFILSSGVEVRYVNNTPNVQTSNSLIFLTEEELFAPEQLGMEIAVFEGKITRVNNIELSFGSESHNKMYRAVAYIKVIEVFRGDVTVGDTVTVLLDAPIGIKNFWVEDTETSSQMTAGTIGIFMPAKYNENSTIQMNGNTLYLQEIAQYGLLDGVRYAFLEKSTGLVFARWAYESVANATSMDEIRQYVRTMLENK